MRVRAAFLTATIVCSPLLAHAQEVSGLDLQALPLPLKADTASVLESPSPSKSSTVRWTLRTSGLKAPLSLRLPSPAPEGASASLVDGVVLTEFTTTVGIGGGWDAGFGFGAHLHQGGRADESAGSGALRGRDPRIGIGWAKEVENWSIRPFAQVHIPLGDAESFAGEEKVRATLGSSVGWRLPWIAWQAQLSYLHRTPVEISSTRWGPQLFLGSGLFVQPTADFDVGAQVALLPVSSRQEGRSGAGGARLLPAEVILAARYQNGRWKTGAALGAGLPLSRTSAVHPEQEAVRGPTTPTYRGLVDLTCEF